MSAVDDLPHVPDTVFELNLRGLRSYIAQDDDDLVMVLEEAGPGNDTAAITLEPGIGAAYQDAIDGAEALTRTATAYASLLRIAGAGKEQGDVSGDRESSGGSVHGGTPGTA